MGQLTGGSTPSRSSKSGLERCKSHVRAAAARAWRRSSDWEPAGYASLSLLVRTHPAHPPPSPLPCRYPGKKSATPEALASLLGAIERFQAALEAPNWLAAGPGYSALIDGPNWVDYFLLVELTKNPDGYRWVWLSQGSAFNAGVKRAGQ